MKIKKEKRILWFGIAFCISPITCDFDLFFSQNVGREQKHSKFKGTPEIFIFCFLLYVRLHDKSRADETQLTDSECFSELNPLICKAEIP